MSEGLEIRDCMGGGGSKLLAVLVFLGLFFWDVFWPLQGMWKLCQGYVIDHRVSRTGPDHQFFTLTISQKLRRNGT